MNYRVELEGVVGVRYSILIDADDEEEAKQIAVEMAPSHNVGLWDVIPSCFNEVTGVDAVDCEEEEQA